MKIGQSDPDVSSQRYPICFLRRGGGTLNFELFVLFQKGGLTYFISLLCKLLVKFSSFVIEDADFV